MVNKLKQLVVQEEGQGMTEYGLVLGTIAVLVVAVLLIFGDGIKVMFGNIIDQLTDATS
ncbi:Flp family type IVb pilin [Bacillaceae bacterium IKA-2]|nr:Flp family type IVb pilin [Bacillaceae bacterium IKA-2]